MEFILNFINKNKRILLYLIFGVLTTLISFSVYYIFWDILKLSATLSNLISWICAVIFAFLTNKPFVFESNNWSASVVTAEFIKFIGGRLGSGVFESIMLLVTVDLLSWNGILMKVLASVFVVIINYVISNYFVFTKK